MRVFVAGQCVTGPATKQRSVRLCVRCFCVCVCVCVLCVVCFGGRPVCDGASSDLLVTRHAKHAQTQSWLVSGSDGGESGRGSRAVIRGVTGAAAPPSANSETRVRLPSPIVPHRTKTHTEALRV